MTPISRRSSLSRRADGPRARLVSTPAVVALVVVALAVATSPGVAATGGASPSHAQSGDTAFTDVNVLPMDANRVLGGQTVVVRDGRITAVGESDRVAVPAGATRIDGRGKYLMPGVAEMHGHYPGEVGSEFFESILFLYVANGVTFVRGMQGGPEHLPLREAVERGEVLGPRLLVSAPMMHGNQVTDAAQAESLVREAAAAGFDHLKVHEELSVEVYEAIDRTADEVGLPYAGHVTNHVGLRGALAAGQHTIDHLDNYLEALIPDRDAVAQLDLFGLGRLAAQIDESRIDEVVRATEESGSGVVPTMALWEILFGSRSGGEWRDLRPEVRYMPRAMVDGWEQGTDQRVEQFGSDPEAIANILALRRRVLKALHEAGVPVLLGTDSPQVFSVPGFSIHHEMELMVESGLTPFDVLYAGTQAVAEFYGETDDHGTVRPGRRADLVLLDRNPLVDVANFADRAGVMVHGRWFPESEIRERLAAIEARVAATE